MEILAESVGWGDYYFFLSVCTIGALVFGSFIVRAVVMYAQLKSFTSDDFFPLIFIVGLTVLFAAGAYGIQKEGPEITYEAKITDFNEVYESGYEIVSKHGSLYTIRKTGEETE